jgi:meiotically up-regulated gene 157 (Mug157) protein
MIEIVKLKKEATDLVESNKLRECMNQMKSYLIDGSSERRALSNLLRRYNELLNEKNLRTIEEDNYSKGMNQITEALLDLVEQLSNANVCVSMFIEPLLIICNEDNRKDMEGFFGEKYFPNAKCINYGDTLPQGIFDVIFLEDENNIITKTTNGKSDGEPIEQNISRRNEMKSYIDSFKDSKEKQFFLYFGQFFPLGYKDNVYFANSRFAIYARLKELLDYIKYYGN